MAFLIKKLKLFLKNKYYRIITFGKPKVFCIGLNKTGTSSVLHVLRHHGFKFGNFGEGERLIDAYKNNEFLKIVSYSKNCNAYKDVPVSLPNVFKYLDSKFPKAKFILTIRNNSEQWYNSITKFHSKVFGNGQDIPTYYDLINCEYCYKGWAWKFIHYTFGTTTEDPYNKETLISVYESHIMDVKGYFENRKERLIIVNVGENNSYLRLCEFLNLKPIFEEFPWINKTSSK